MSHGSYPAPERLSVKFIMKGYWRKQLHYTTPCTKAAVELQSCWLRELTDFARGSQMYPAA